ncbi:MAG: hypothetical protein MRY79_09255, partial [Alphaproteobacteria bacterium]|nr:hypothetical protein [Alphaproteobacteria bacterium]
HQGRLQPALPEHLYSLQLPLSIIKDHASYPPPKIMSIIFCVKYARRLVIVIQTTSSQGKP